MAQTFCHARVALADMGGFLAMDCVVGMSLPAVSVMSMQRGVVRVVRRANNLAEVEAVIVRNFAPALTGLELPHNGIEALARGLRQQVRLFQAAVAQPRRCFLGSECIDGNSGLVGDSRQDMGTSGRRSCMRNSDSENEGDCRND